MVRIYFDTTGVYPRVCGGIPLPAFALGGVRVYPRVCGGIPGAAAGNGRTAGLSPRVRGNLRGDEVIWASKGSIPACAGESFFFDPFRLPERVYPRVCGGI